MVNRWINCIFRRILVSTTIKETIVAWGCPQGVLFLLKWNLLVNELLYLLDHNGFNVLGYSYKLVILVQSKYNNRVKGRMQQALNIITIWTEEEHEAIQIDNHIKRTKLKELDRIYLDKIKKKAEMALTRA